MEPIEDERGFFARIFCREEFDSRALCSRFVQNSVSFNRRKGTLRGMHYQAAPIGEVKLVRCTRGAVYDVVVDLRPDSDSFKQWIAVELTMDNGRTLYVPERVAHGFMTLEDNTEVCYQLSQYYKADYSRGVRWDDPAVGVKWPLEPCYMSEKDITWPLVET